MAKTKQFTIAVENRPGAVAEIARTLGNAKVNILALLGTAQDTSGSVQLVVEDSKRASAVAQPDLSMIAARPFAPQRGAAAFGRIVVRASRLRPSSRDGCTTNRDTTRARHIETARAH